MCWTFFDCGSVESLFIRKKSGSTVPVHSSLWNYLLANADICQSLRRELLHPLPWAPGGCCRAAEAWCWACLWAVWWRPALSDTPRWAWPGRPYSGLTTPGSQRSGSGAFVPNRPSPIAGSGPDLGSTRLPRHCRPRSPSTPETLQGHKTQYETLLLRDTTGRNTIQAPN